MHYSTHITSWADPWFYNSDIITENTLAEAAFYASGNAHPVLRHTGSGQGLNEINGGLYNILLNNAQVSAGENSENDFCNAGSADLRVENGGVAYAEYNYWPGGTATVSNDGTGTAYTGNSLGVSSCSSSLQVQEIASRGVEVENDIYLSSTGASNSSPPAFYALVSNHAPNPAPSPRAMLHAAHIEATIGHYADAAAMLKALIKQHPNAKEAGSALTALGHMFEPLLASSSVMPSQVLNFVGQVAAVKGPLRAQGLEVLAHLYERTGDDAAALAAIKEAMALGPQSDRLFDAQSSAFYLHFGMGRFYKAAEVLASIEPQDDMERYEKLGMEWLLYLETGNKTTGAPEAISIAKESATKGAKPAEHLLLQAISFPNPFEETARIRYLLPEQSHVRLKVFDLLGRQVRVLVDEIQFAGSHVAQFNALELASGTYIYRLQTQYGVKTGRMTLR